ncbi:uncharacterized protein LOC124280294 [Haliotis rubra]|uniref:uncharacterized protein LOC124280294 n=1 Tax=Haliotis rubra TaxID=36100 RepID=UPI001EE54735|nr:uncharacterized protein LOC124280294 [Haliotis rubra]
MGMFRKLVSSGNNVISEARQFGLVTSALSVCVNNPQNEENQRLCSTLLPHIFSLLMRVSEPQTLCPVLSLVGVMVANNVFNQDRVKKCGGLDTLGSLLCNLTNRSGEEDNLMLAVQVVGALDSCLMDNEVNINRLREVCGFGPLFSLLTPGLLSQQEQLQVVVTLSHVLQDNSGALAGVSSEDYQQLVCLLTQAQDEELVKALKYVLQMIQDSECDKQKAQPEMKPTLKKSSQLILEKIDELSARLETYKEESNQTTTTNLNNNCTRLPSTSGQHITDHLPDPQTGYSHLLDARNKCSPTEPIKQMYDRQHTAEPPHINWTDISQSNVMNNDTPNKALPRLDFNSERNTSRGSPHLMNWLRHLIPEALLRRRDEVKEYSYDYKSQGKHSATWRPTSVVDYNHCCRSDSGIADNGLGQDRVTSPHCSDNMCFRSAQSRSVASSDVHGYNSFQHQASQYETNGEHENRSLHGKYEQSLNKNSCNSQHIADRNNCVCSAVERCDDEHKSDGHVHIEKQKYTGLSNEPKDCFGQCCHMVNCKTNARDRKCEDCAYVSKKVSARDGGCGKDCSNTVPCSQWASSTQNTSSENTLVEKSPHHSQKWIDESVVMCSCVTDNGSLTKQKGAAMDISKNACVHSEKPGRGVRSLHINVPASSVTPQRNRMMIPTPNSCQSAVFKTPAPVAAPSQTASVKGQFLKPVNTPLRRKTEAPSSCGSSSTSSRRNVRLLARRSVVGIQESASPRHSPPRAPSTPRVTPVPSPAQSEFDLALLTSAKRTRCREVDMTELSGPCTPTVRKLSTHQLRCWTDVHRPTVCPSPAYSKPLSVLGWSQLSDTDSDSIYTHSEDETSSRGSVAGEDDQEKRTDKYQTMRGLCPGCHPPCQLQYDLLNSRTYNIAMETNSSTCIHHREMREAEREFILRQKSSKVPSKSRPIPALSDANFCRSCPPAKGLAAYDFHVSSSETDIGKRFVSPPHPTDSRKTVDVVQLHRTRTRQHKRKRVAYSQEELDNLSHGVETLGTKWNQILVTYKFHPSRTAVDLREKHRRMVKSSSASKKRARDSKPFSMCEERRLRRGVKTLGYNWKGIISMFRFSRGRRAEDLRNRWRTLMKTTST